MLYFLYDENFLVRRITMHNAMLIKYESSRSKTSSLAQAIALVVLSGEQGLDICMKSIVYKVE